MILPLYSTFMRPHSDSSLESSAQGCGSIGGSPEEATKIIIDLEHLSSENRLREMMLVSLEKARLQEDLTAAFQYLRGASQKAGEGFFIREYSKRTRDNDSKLKENRFRLNSKKKLFTSYLQIKNCKHSPNDVPNLCNSVSRENSMLCLHCFV